MGTHAILKPQFLVLRNGRILQSANKRNAPVATRNEVFGRDKAHFVIVRAKGIQVQCRQKAVHQYHRAWIMPQHFHRLRVIDDGQRNHTKKVVFCRKTQIVTFPFRRKRSNRHKGLLMLFFQLLHQRFQQRRAQGGTDATDHNHDQIIMVLQGNRTAFLGHIVQGLHRFLHHFARFPRDVPLPRHHAGNG